MILLTSRLCIAVVLAAVCFQGLLYAQDETPGDLERADEILKRWVGRKDIGTSLIKGSDDQWSIRTTAADLYPALVLTAWFTNLDLYQGLLQETLNDEVQLTSRLSVFPDDYHVRNQRFARSSRNTEEILINAAAYAGGLSRIASVVGHSPWTDRLRSLVDALFLRADVATGYSEGALPSNDLRVLGRILKVLPLLAALYEDEGYLYYARRIADAYCVGVMPKNGGLPAERWNFGADKARASSLILNEDGVAFIEGLVALYEVEARTGSARADIYRPTVSAMFDALFTHGLKEEGRFYRRLQPDGRGGYSIDRKRESPYALRILIAAHQYGILSGNGTYVTRSLDALSAYSFDPKEAARDLPALIRASRVSDRLAARVAAVRDVLDTIAPSSDWDESRDAALLRALLASAWSTSGGVRTHPWRSDLVVSAQAIANGLSLTGSVDRPWSGRVFLTPAHPAVDLSGPFRPALPISGDLDYEISTRFANSTAVWVGSVLFDGLSVDVEDRFDLTIREHPATPAASP